MTYDQIIAAVAEELNLPESTVKSTYKAYWEFIRSSIEQLPLKEDLNDQQFAQLKLNFNIPSLGKLNCTRDRYLGIKRKFEYIKSLKERKC